MSENPGVSSGLVEEHRSSVEVVGTDIRADNAERRDSLGSHVDHAVLVL